MNPNRVVVTGATGYIAAQLLPAFEERYDLTLLDVRTENREGEPVPGVQVVDLADPDVDRYREHFAGADAVVHLAYHHPEGSWSDLTYYAERRNVDMAFHVYRLALEEGIRRVVMASSNHAADWYEEHLLERRRDMVQPFDKAFSYNFYGWAKDAYEHMGFLFACGTFGEPVEVAQIRIGAPRELDGSSFEGDPRAFKRNLGAYISERDLQQLFIRSLEADSLANRELEGVPFQIFYGVSDNTRHFWSIANARRVIGYEPADDSELRFADDIRRHLIEGEGADHPGRV